MLKLSKHLLFIFSISLISLYTLYPSFKLSLFGDDWLVIYTYILDVGNISGGLLKHLHEYLSAYGPTQVFMGILEQFYGYNSTLYYVTSYFFRLFAAFSLFPITFYLTKNRLSAFFAVLFFSITTTGFDTTNWVFNMTSYVAIGLVSLFLYFYLKSKEEGKSILLLPAVFLLYSAYITASIRMHATLPLLILLEVFWNFREKNIHFAKKSIIRLSLVIAIILFIRFTGTSFGQPAESAGRLRDGLNTFKILFNQGRYDFLAFPIASFGAIFIPDAILPFQGQVSSLTNFTINMVLPILLMFAVMAKLLIKLTSNSKKGVLGILFALTIIWTIISIIIYKGNTSTFSSSAYNSLLLIGGYIFILGLVFIIKNINQKSISTLLILSLTWIFLSYVYAWLWRPELYLTTNRYLIVGAAGAAIFLAGLISLGKSRHNQIIIFILFIPLLIMHIYSTRLYEYQLVSSGHGQETFNKIWASIPYLPEINKKERVSVFLFLGDGINGGILHDSITFGFSPHMALLYNITNRDKIPLVLESWEEVVSTVKDGKAFIRQYGITKDPIPVDNVYVFKLEGNDHLIDLTAQARKKLLEEL